MKTKSLSIDARMLFSGGVGTYLQNLMARMPLQELGLRIVLYVRTAEDGVWLQHYQPRAEIRVCPHWSTVKDCPHWLYGIQEQLFWTKYLNGGAFWAPYFNIPFFGPEKLIVTLHDAAFHLTPNIFLLYRFYARAVYWRIGRKADAILTVSEFARKGIEKRAGLWKSPIHVINLGVGEEWFALEETQRPYPFRYFIYVGNIKPHKNLPRLLKAFEKAAVEQKLVCVGAFKNSKFRDEEAMTEIKRLGDRVVFTDEIIGKPLRTLVKHSDGLVVPSLEEAFSLPPLEGMAAGVPILASDIESLTDLHRGKLLLCDPYEINDIARGLREMAGLQGVARERIITDGIAHARRFNWDKTAKETFEVMKKVFVN